MRWACLVLAGCARVLGLDDIHPTDAAIDAIPCAANITPGDFSSTTMLFVGTIDPSPTMDQTLMYNLTSNTIAYSTYSGGMWLPPTTVPELDDPNLVEDRPSLSYDGQHLFFARYPMTGGYQMPFEATRMPGAGQRWNAPTPVVFPGALGSNDVAFGVPTLDGNDVVVLHGTVQHEVLAELVLRDGAWVVADTLAALYPAGINISDTTPQLSPDGCWLLFSRLDNNASTFVHELYFAVRGPDGNFEAPQKLLTNALVPDIQHAWLSPDATTLYYFDGDNDTTYVAQRR